MPRSATAQAVPLVFLLTLVWGTNWALFPLAVREVSVWTFRGVSLFGAGLMLLAFARWKGMSLKVARGDRLPLVAASLLYLVVWNVASTYAAVLIPSGQAAILGFTMPIWATLIGWAFLRDRPAPRLIAAIMLSATGVGLLVFAGRHAYANAPAGFMLGLLAGVGWAAGTLVLKQRPLQLPAVVLTGWQLLVASVPLGLGAIAFGTGETFMPSWRTVAIIGYITVVPMAMGNAAWFAIVGLLPANVSGLSGVMVPMVAMVTGAIVYGEPLGVFQLAAMACCGGALLLALYKPAPRPTR